MMLPSSPQVAPRMGGRIGQCDSRAAQDRDLLELIVRRETDPLAVRGEERIRRVFGSRQRSGRDLAQQTSGQLRVSVGTTHWKYNASLVGRDGHGRPGAGHRVRPQIDAQPDQWTSFGRAVEIKKSQHDRGGSGKPHPDPRHQGLPRGPGGGNRRRRLVQQQLHAADVPQPLLRIFFETPLQNPPQAFRAAVKSGSFITTEASVTV